MKAMRLNKKTITAKGIEWVPSETVLVTFEGSTLPEYFKIFRFYNVKQSATNAATLLMRCGSNKVCMGCGTNTSIEDHKCKACTINAYTAKTTITLSPENEFKLKCIGDNARTDLKPNPQWPTLKALTNKEL
ncbi:hypothetical protein WN51_08151 [Melipona quadrifasciata]|uniref:Uncharacterized protein n=1 Tax=Melipona quadrifasciata TaxID=166423 RepID=A0A0N0BBZ2_9HYME|nr:hypothetical protein WN51_08151 [Melipona quadrifasciata]